MMTYILQFEISIRIKFSNLVMTYFIGYDVINIIPSNMYLKLVYEVVNVK